MQRINEMKSIMRKLKEIKNESVEADTSAPVNEAVLKAVNEEADKNGEDEISTENDASENDLLLARLEDLVDRLERVIPADEEEKEETPAEEEGASDEEPSEEETPEEETSEDEEAPEEESEESAEEAYHRSLEERLAALERRFTESRRRSLCSRFKR